MKSGDKEKIIFQVGATIFRLHNIFELNYLQSDKNVHDFFYKSVFTECIIELNYLLSSRLLKKAIKEINFKEDISAFESKGIGQYSDIVSLIRFFRNTICHADDTSKRENEITGQYFAYTIRTFADYHSGLEGFDQCPFEGEIAIVFGRHKIFIKRHLFRVYKNLETKVLEWPEFEAFKKIIYNN